MPLLFRSAPGVPQPTRYQGLLREKTTHDVFLDEPEEERAGIEEREIACNGAVAGESSSCWICWRQERLAHEQKLQCWRSDYVGLFLTL